MVTPLRVAGNIVVGGIPALDSPSAIPFIVMVSTTAFLGVGYATRVKFVRPFA
jgi:hypothetical protein